MSRHGHRIFRQHAELNARWHAKARTTFFVRYRVRRFEQDPPSGQNACFTASGEEEEVLRKMGGVVCGDGSGVTVIGRSNAFEWTHPRCVATAVCAFRRSRTECRLTQTAACQRGMSGQGRPPISGLIGWWLLRRQHQGVKVRSSGAGCQAKTTCMLLRQAW
jgi:hypothetical protein